jgi:hypothetical protein
MSRLRQEEGQAVPLVAAGLLVMLLAIAALVIDYGGALVLKHKAQAAADASALAAAWSIPDGVSAEESTATSMLAANASPGLSTTPTVTPATSAVASDSVKVSVSGTFTPTFANLVGIDSIPVSATATATVKSVLGCTGHGCDSLPWGVPDCAVNGSTVDCSQPLRASLGQRVTLKTDAGAGGKFYALKTPIVSGSACASPNNAPDYSATIQGVWGGNASCNIRTAGPASSGYSTAGCNSPGDTSVPTCVIPVKTGNIVGPTNSGLESRLSCSSSSCNGDTLSYITGGCNPATSWGHFCPVLHQSPRLVVVPIVRNLDNSAGYAGCGSGSNCNVKVIDLVYFYIDATYAQINGSTVTGTFFRSTVPPNFDLLGPYNGGSLVRVGLSR